MCALVRWEESWRRRRGGNSVGVRSGRRINTLANLTLSIFRHSYSLYPLVPFTQPTDSAKNLDNFQCHKVPYCFLTPVRNLYLYPSLRFLRFFRFSFTYLTTPVFFFCFFMLLILTAFVGYQNVLYLPTYLHIAWLRWNTTLLRFFTPHTHGRYRIKINAIWDFGVWGKFCIFLMMSSRRIG